MNETITAIITIKLNEVVIKGGGGGSDPKFIFIVFPVSL